MKQVIILLSLVLLVGCSLYEETLPVEEQPTPEPIIKEVIVYRDRNITINISPSCPTNITEIINITCPKYQYGSEHSTERELELIRRLKFLENNQNKYFNDSECNDDLNKTRVELNECKNELCNEWNSSWC